MISSIEWIPAGVADPNPKKYELSATEQELIQLMQEKGNLDEHLAEARDKISSKANLPKIENTLPPDLRMDEYSSDDDDEEEDEGKDGAAIGRLLVGASGDMADDESEGEEDEGQIEYTRDKDSDDESDDDLNDVPDTREFEPVDVEGLEAMGMSHVGMSSAMYMNGLGQDENDDDSEAEDVALSADDALVVVAKTEDDFASLEVYVYDQKKGNLYVHHDIPLPAFPLCLAHGQVSSNGTTGNFCAVGTFSPGIEVWNLDVLNALEPSCILGGEDTSAADDLMKLQIMNAASGAAGSETQAISSRQRSSRSRGGLRPGSHTDAVMALSWNPIHKQVIASGSADGTVKLWDVTKAGSGDAKCNAGTFSHHKDKVQSVAWNPKEGTLLASGSYDRTVALVDARSDGKTSNVKSVRIAADCEALAWDPFRPEYLTVASEDGTISCWDVRKFETSTPIWSFVASEYGGVTDLSYNAQVPGMMVTCSIDKSVTLWDAHNVQNDNVIKFLPPRPCGSKDMCAGKLYAVGFYPSSPWLLGCGGSGNLLSLWDLSSEETIQKRFRGRLGSGTIEPEPVKEDEYQAMMSGKDEHSSTNATNSNGKGSDQKKKKSKRKAHRKS